MKKFQKEQGGFIRVIFLILFLMFILSAFSLDITEKLWQRDEVQYMRNGVERVLSDAREKISEPAWEYIKGVFGDATTTSTPEVENEAEGGA